MKSDNYEYKNIFFDGVPISPSNKTFPCAGFKSSAGNVKKISLTEMLKRMAGFFAVIK